MSGASFWFALLRTPKRVDMTTSENKPNILEIKGVTKNFPGVIAIDKVDLDIKQGEVHVLVGQNGAGKSSLVKLLCGVYQPDEGEILFEGKKYHPQRPEDAFKAGIRIVYQELNLLSYLSVAENILFEKLPRKNGLLDYKTLYKKARTALEEVGLDIPPQTLVEELGIAQMQLIEIAKALSNESKLLILDEPTATLTPREISRLFNIIHHLKQRGVTIIYISHHLNEIYEIGDRVTVLRNGQKVETRRIQSVTIPEIVKMMVGRDMKEEFLFRSEVVPGPQILKVEGLRYRGNPHSISFTLRQGEILGVAGLVGAGRTETMRALYGADPKLAGKIFLNGQAIKIKRPKDAVKHNICLLTEDRKSQGLIIDMPCYVNISLADLKHITKWGLIDKQAERKAAEQLVKDLGIKTPSIDQIVRNLSGGNQQKVVIAKWLFRNTEVFICDEPTRGIDVGAKYEIYNLLWELASQGKGLIVVSSDLPELMGICHRLIVFSKGKLVGQLERSEFDQERILALAYQEYIKTGIEPTDVQSAS